MKFSKSANLFLWVATKKYYDAYGDDDRTDAMMLMLLTMIPGYFTAAD